MWADSLAVIFHLTPIHRSLELGAVHLIIIICGRMGYMIANYILQIAMDSPTTIILVIPFLMP